MPRLGSFEQLDPATKEKVQREAENKRRDELAAMAEAQRKERIAQELQKANERARAKQQKADKQPENAGVSETVRQKTAELSREQRHKPDSNLFTRIAEIMLQESQKEGFQEQGRDHEKEKDGRKAQEISGSVEMAAKNLNFLLNKKEILGEQETRAIRDNMEQRVEAQMSLILTRDAISRSNLPPRMKEQAMFVVTTLIKENQSDYKESQGQIARQPVGKPSEKMLSIELSDDKEKLAEQRKLVRKENGTEKPPTAETMKSPKEQETERQRKLRAKRVSGFREIRKIDQRIKQIEEHGSGELIESDEIDELRKRKRELLAEEYQRTMEIEIRTGGGETDKATLLSKLKDTEFIQSIIDDRDNKLLRSEKKKLSSLTAFFAKPESAEIINQFESLLNTGKDPRELEKLINYNPELMTVLETIAHPETSGRIEMTIAATQEKDNLTPTTDEFAQEYAQYENWKRNGPIEQRLAAAEEDFMAKILLLNTADFTESDLYLTLESYGLANITYDDRPDKQDVQMSLKDMSQIEVGKDRDDLSAAEIQELRKQSFERAKFLLEQAQKIRRQHQTGWEIVGYEMDQQYESQEARHQQLISDIQKDILSNFNKVTGRRLEIPTDQDGFLQKLHKAGVVELQVTPTGLAIVVNSYLVSQRDEPALREMLSMLGHNGTAANEVKREGLGVTFRPETALGSLNESIIRDKYRGLTETEPPIVNIAVLPEDPTKRDRVFDILHHEITDHLIESMDTENLPISPDEIRTMRALRELSSRINDRTIGARNLNGELVPIYLDDLYLQETKDNQGETKAREDALFKLIRASEIIIQSKVESIATHPSRDIQEVLLREQLAFKIRNKIREKLSLRAEGANIPMSFVINQTVAELLSENGKNSEYDQYIQKNKAAKNKFDKEVPRHIPNSKYEDFYMFSSPTTNGGGKSYVGTSDGVNPSNKALRGARAYSQFDGADVPPFYGEPGKAALNTIWEYADEGTGLIPLTVVVPGLRHIPVVRNIFMKIPAPTPMTRSYLFKRGVSARFARSFDPYLRKVGKTELVHEDLGANPVKLAALISPELEHRFKSHLPGYVTAHKIGEGRENTPINMQLTVYQTLYQKGPGWLAEIGVGDGIIDQKDMYRYLGNMLGLSYEFDGQQYRVKIDHPSLREYDGHNEDAQKDIKGFEKWDGDRFKGLGLKNAKKYGEGNDAKYGFKYDGKRFRPSEGALKSLLFDSARKGPSQAQKDVDTFFKNNARRSDLPSSTGNIMYWERQIGKNFRNYLKERDGYLALKTLAQEHDHFANVPRTYKDKDGNVKDLGKEGYTLFELVNLVHYGDEKTEDDKIWLRNNSGKDIEVTIIQNGKKKKVKIADRDYIRDPHGNLIPSEVKLKTTKNKKNQEVLDLKDGMVQARDDDARTIGLWGRLVGDYENPHLRYIRLNSEAAADTAIGLFGQDRDDGFVDKDNILLRTDGIKEALHNVNINRITKSLETGIAPDRKYAMQFEDLNFIDENGVTRKDRVAVIKFRDGLFDATGKPTEKFKSSIKDLINKIYHQPGDSSYAQAEIAQIEMAINSGQFNKFEASRYLENLILSTTGASIHGGEKRFEDFVEFSKDPTWQHPYRQELQAIKPMAGEELGYMADTFKSGFEALQGRYDKAQNYLFQWQKALKKVSQYERIAYTAMGHYKGTARMMTRVTNLALISSGLLMAFGPVNPLSAWGFIGALGARKMFKPWVIKQQETWKARRIKALGRQQEIEGLDGVFAKGMEGGIPTEYEYTRMMHTCERLIWFLEDLSTAKADDHWYPWDDKVISGWSNMMKGMDEYLKNLK